MIDERPTLVCIAGTTASGKSSLAMTVAESLGAEILSVDSMQVYRGFDIGTAKPTAEERARVPHHGLDFVDPTETCSAGRYIDVARTAVDDACRREVPLLAVGGTGLYMRAMLHGLAPQAPSDVEVRASLRAAEAADPGCLHRELETVDPEAAERLHPNDLVRVERALEVFRITGRPLSVVQQEHGFRPAPFRFRLYVIERSRDELRARVRARLERMFERGWVEEVRNLLRVGVPESAPAMRALGYRDIAAHLRDGGSESALLDRIETLTMRFAKRQVTWFNREPSVLRLTPDEGLADRFLADVGTFLKSPPRREGALR